MQGRPKVPKNLLEIPNSIWEHTIDEYIKSEIDRQIAKLYYLKGYAQQDVADEVGYSRSAIKHKLPKLLNIIEKNIGK